ncbi:MAG: phospholipid carrier-dependent glycosyltransferase [Nocardioidaceae bacterium]|nr:phospholipid carrier-dependent glycosyltransferase [Nocardioidaceae bacterium]
MRRRLTPLHYRSDPKWGWLAPLIVTFFAGLLQFWSLTSPPDITFDETYYAKDAYSLLVKQHAVTFINDSETDESEADKIINSGSTEGIFADPVSMVVHPEVGKWMIAFGEWLFGMNALGWRFSAALVGTLMVLVMCRLVRRLTGSTLLGCAAGLLLAFDGLHFVMSRIALLDIFMAFWLLCAVACLVADRDWARVRMARRREPLLDVSRRGFGPVRGLLFRPWRIGAGVCFGLAVGVKWNALFVIAGFGLLAWAWDCGMRRSMGVRWAVAKSFVADAIPGFFSIVGVALVVYVVSWMGFLTHAELYEDEFGHAVDGNDWTWSSVDDNPGNPVGHVAHDLNILWNYHKEVYMFHTGDYIREATHPFQSDPGGWLLINRPLGIASVSGDSEAVPECPEGQECVKQVLAIGTPVLWWGGVIALFVGLGYWLSRRDWRFGIPIVGVLTTWLPWFRYDDRPIFFYYAIAIIPFTVIAVTLVLGKVLGKSESTYPRRLVGVLAAGVFVLAVAANFAYFYPILANQLLSNEAWNDRMWLVEWI